MAAKVLVVGGVSYNLMVYLETLPQPEIETVFSRAYHEAVGMTGAGKALNLKPLGLDVTLHGLIGADEYGERIKAYFERAGLDFVHDIDPAGTKRHLNLMDKEGGRISIFLESGTFEPEIDLARLDALVAASDVVALNIINYCRWVIPLAKKHGKPIWCDIHEYDGANAYHQAFIDAADCLFMSSGAMPDYRAFMAAWMAEGKQLAVCTHGKDGSTALWPGGQWIEMPALAAYELVDSNGAGDAFMAGVLYGQLGGHSLEQSLRLGTITAGVCITSREIAAPTLSEARLRDEYAQHYGEPLG